MLLSLATTKNEGSIQVTDAGERELSWFSDELAELGFASGTKRAYVRALAEFFTLCPPTGNGEIDSVSIEGYLKDRAIRADSQTVQASLRKWLHLKYGICLAKQRDCLANYPTSDYIAAEIDGFRARLNEDKLSQGYIKSTCRACAMLLGWLFNADAVSLSAIDSFAAIRFLNERRSHLSPGATKAEAVRLRRYLHYVDERLNRNGENIPINPPKWGGGPLPNKISEEDFALLTRCDGSDRSVLVGAAACLMGNLGLRCGEVAALTLDDMALFSSSILVRAGKGLFGRRLPLDQATGEALAKYVVEVRPKTESRRVFIRSKSHRGEPMTVSQIRGMLRYQARCAGIEDFATHMLRRRAASSLVEAGVPLKIVADIHGHESMQTTMEYLRIDLERLRIVAGDWAAVRHG